MHLFISYAHEDKHQVQQLVDILRAGNHEPWFDHRLVVGQDWKDQLADAIKHCEAFVYVLSPRSVASQWCQWEFAQAVQQGKPIIPVLLTKNTNLPTALQKYQYADFTRGATPESTARLMGGLSVISFIIPPEEAPSAPQSPIGVPTSALQPKADSEKLGRFKLTESRAIIIGAVITGIFVVIAAIIPLLMNVIEPSPATSTTLLTATSLVLLNTTLPVATASWVKSTSIPAINTVTSNSTQLPENAGSLQIKLERSPDTIALCASNAVLDTTKLQIRIGLNESYTIGDLFGDGATALPEQCWCIQQRNPHFPSPSSCMRSNTSVRPNVGDWRNSAITVLINKTAIGTCQAQPSQDIPYECALK